jgi:hypothetical protein
LLTAALRYLRSFSLYRAHDQALMAHCTALPLAAVTRALLAFSLFDYCTEHSRYVGLLSQYVHHKATCTCIDDYSTSISHIVTPITPHQTHSRHCRRFVMEEVMKCLITARKPTGATRSLTPNLQRTSHHIAVSRGATVRLSGANTQNC